MVRKVKMIYLLCRTDEAISPLSILFWCQSLDMKIEFENT